MNFDTLRIVWNSGVNLQSLIKWVITNSNIQILRYRVEEVSFQVFGGLENIVFSSAIVAKNLHFRFFFLSLCPPLIFVICLLRQRLIHQKQDKADFSCGIHSLSTTPFFPCCRWLLDKAALPSPNAVLNVGRHRSSFGFCSAKSVCTNIILRRRYTKLGLQAEKNPSAP